MTIEEIKMVRSMPTRYYPTGGAPQRRLRAAAVVCGILYAGVAYATSAPAPVAVAEPTVMDALRPILGDVVNLLLTIVLTIAGFYLKAKWNIDVDKERRDTLQTSLTNVAALMLKEGRTRAEAVDLSRLRASAPDAIKHFDLTDKPATLAEKIEGKVPQIVSTASVT